MGNRLQRSKDDITVDLKKDQDAMHQKAYQEHQEAHIQSALNQENPDHNTHIEDDIEEEIVSSIMDTIPSTDAQDYDLDTVMKMLNDNETTQSPISVPTDSNTHNNRNDTNDDTNTMENIAEADEDPIVSNIQSTDGPSKSDDDEDTMNDVQYIGDTTNDVDEGEESVSEGIDDEGFDSNVDSNAADWGDFNESSYDGQDFVERTDPPSSRVLDPMIGEALMPCVISPNNGQSSKLKSVKGEAECRAWICEQCHALNNLMDSINRHYGCIVCAGKYRPGQTLIASKEQDVVSQCKEHNLKSEQPNVWYCHNCSELNPLHKWRCSICHMRKPTSDLITFSSSEAFRPPPNAIKYKPRPNDIMKDLGDFRTPQWYPHPMYTPDINPKVSIIFGEPYRTSFCRYYQWSRLKTNGMINVRKQASQEPSVYVQPIFPKCIAINEENGYIAMIQKRFIVVLSPKGATEFIIHSYRDHALEITSDTRIRFVWDKIYILVTASSVPRFLCYRFVEAKHEIIFLDRIFDAYFTKRKMADFALKDELLIVLFDQWIGIYILNITDLKPTFTWYHAIAYSETGGVTPYAMEMCVYDEVEYEEKQENDEIVRKQSIKDYMYILCEDSIISVHPTDPTYEYLYHAENVHHDASFCNSKKYGTFWINQEGNKISHSGRCDKDITHVFCSLSDVQSCGANKWNKFKMLSIVSKQDITNKHITRFNSVVYDEGYGISGRLLIGCTAKHNKQEISMFYQVFNEDELMVLKNELKRTSHKMNSKKWINAIGKPFNFVVVVFEMLYGSDLIENRI